MKTKAAVLRRMGAEGDYDVSRPFSVESLDLAPPGPGEVLVRVAAAGLCHSDLSVVTGERPRPMPMVLGHEAAGVVEALGAGVDDVEEGDHVVRVFMPSCGRCQACAEGRPAICERGAAANAKGVLLSGARRLGTAAEPINHHLGVSAFAERAVVSRHSVVRIDKGLPLDVAALFGCAVLTGVGAVVYTAGVRQGQAAAVVGLGGVGLAALLGAVAAGAYPIVAVDVQDDKLVLARTLGATHAVDAKSPDAVEEIRALTGGGAEYAFELAGSVPALETAVRATRRGGTTVTAGLPPSAATPLPLNVTALVAEERTLMGSFMGSCVPTRDIPRFVALHRAGRLPVDRLVTHWLALEDINLGFDRLRSGQAIRQIIQFQETH
jgi:alcohol dehydrogenase